MDRRASGRQVGSGRAVEHFKMFGGLAGEGAGGQAGAQASEQADMRAGNERTWGWTD